VKHQKDLGQTTSQRNKKQTECWPSLQRVALVEETELPKIAVDVLGTAQGYTVERLLKENKIQKRVIVALFDMLYFKEEETVDIQLSRYSDEMATQDILTNEGVPFG
jgi:hypothetical protein